MLNFKKIVLRRGTKVVLSQATATIQVGEKVGLIGRNGAGKSSLFALITRQLQEDQGEWAMPDTWEISQVEQHIPETDQGATDFVLEGDLRLGRVLAELQQAELRDDGEAMALAHAALDDAGGHTARSRAQAMLLGLGFKSDELDNPVNSFSGGWRMRLQLSRALMCPADLMLLDEPTNHLDLDALVWLEDWLKRYEGTMLVISHDRDFLDAVTRVTLHLDNAQLTRYGGNYSAFETLLAQQQALQQSAFEKQQDRIAHLQKFIDRFKAKASKAKQAQSRVKALDRMEKIAPLMSDADFQFEFKEPANLPNPMLSMQHVDFGYAASKPTEPDASPTIIVRDVSKSVLAGQRIGILGANGQGKSTVVKTIARDLPALSGDITEGKGLNIGYFAQQELDVLRPADNPLEHMIALLKKVTTEGKLSGQATREQDLRSYLGQFNFGGDMVKQSVGSMSGGEKARLVLCMMVWQRPNLLLLDEPTNHLDLTTREALSMALNEFEGTVMLVSHDRALLRAVCDEFWLVSKGGIAPFDGDLDDYQQFLFEEAKRLKALAQSETVASTPKAAPAVIKNSKPSQQQKTFQKQQQLVESDMQDLELEKTRLLEAMSATTLTDELMALGKQLKVAENKLSELEVQWLELLESSEQA